MYSFSSFKNNTVICNNTEIGTLYDLIFSKIEHKVIGFTIKKNLINYSYFYFKDIESISADKIFIKEELTQIDDNTYEIIGKGVYDLLDNKIGVVDDIEFHSLNGKLLSISVEINKGLYLISRFRNSLRQKNFIKINAKNIISFEKDKIIIKNSNSIKESKKILENINKFFINVGVASKKLINN